MRARSRRSRRPTDRQVSRLARTGTAQHDPHPQHAHGRDPIDVPLRLIPRTSPRCGDPTSARDSRQTHPQSGHDIPRPRRDRRPARRPRPRHMGRSPRPRPTRHRTADRVTSLGTDRAALPRHRARHRPPRPLRWQRPQATLHTAHIAHRRCAQSVACRIRCRRRRSTLSDKTRRTDRPRLCR